MVYATNWRSERLLYYRYAPPPTEQDEFRDEELPKKPYPGARPYERSVYFYWWAFLQEHEGYREFCETHNDPQYTRLYRDFGDLRPTDFVSWWRSKGQFLFCEPLERLVRVHKVADSGDVSIERANGHIVVSFPADGHADRILTEIGHLISRERATLTTVSNWSEAKYPVATKPVLSSLHQHLHIWKLRRSHPELPLHELAKTANLQFSRESDNPSDRAIVVSRYLRQAACIIEHVGKGQFPILKPSQLKERPAKDQLNLRRPRSKNEQSK
ncbi:hypothetical protein [Devosia sp.]|uniref:hypothetical protein n=1 Tax=Devosia sp. TaxID=1871048 RepID=UPI003BAC93A1